MSSSVGTREISCNTLDTSCLERVRIMGVPHYKADIFKSFKRNFLLHQLCNSNDIWHEVGVMYINIYICMNEDLWYLRPVFLVLTLDV